MGTGYATYGYFSCDQSWFFGSEITAIAQNTGYAGGGATAIVANYGKVNVYGSNIRLLSTDGAVYSSSGMTAVSAYNNTEIHIHGTGIDVISTGANNIVALAAYGGSTIHANEAAYNLKTGTGGTVTRISKDTHPATDVHAPYLWPGHSTPPNIISQDGADTAVITTPGGKPRMVIYSTFCASKWFDVGLNDCR